MADWAAAPGKMHEFFHKVARHFDIPREEYVDVLPDIPEPSAAIPLAMSQPSYGSPRAAATAPQDAYPMGYNGY